MTKSMLGAVFTLAMIAVLSGCGRGRPDNLQVIPAQKLWVQDDAGREYAIAADELVDSGSGESSHAKILVLDTSAEEERWIPIAEFLQNRASAPQYLPVDPSTRGHGQNEDT